MKKWIASAIILAALIFGSVIGFNMFKEKKIHEYFASLPISVFPVTAMTIKAEDWIPNLRAIGFIEPVRGVVISNEVTGKVVKVNFESGQAMTQGDPIIYLDSSVERANLKSAKASLPSVERNFKRMNALLKKGAGSQAQVDDAKSSYLALLAEIESHQATINLRTIRAPFTGVAGLRNVFLGQYLQNGSNIVRLEDLSTMQLRFTVAQNDLNKVFIGQKVNLSVDAQPGIVFTGTISAIEPAVNYQSGLVQIQASIPNDKQLLRSGMFTKAEVILPTLKKQIAIPETSINYTLYGNTVYVLKEQKAKDGSTFLQANQEIVTLGDTKVGQVHVISGLNENDVVATSGQVRLNNGSRVKIVESHALDITSPLPSL